MTDGADSFRRGSVFTNVGTFPQALYMAGASAVASLVLLSVALPFFKRLKAYQVTRPASQATGGSVLPMFCSRARPSSARPGDS